MRAAASGRRRRQPRRRGAWLARLVAFVALACLVVVASASPICEMACAFDGVDGSAHGHAAVHEHAGSRGSHDASEGLHAGACHLSAFATPSALPHDVGMPELPRAWAAAFAAALDSMSWPPPEHPPRAGSAS